MQLEELIFQRCTFCEDKLLDYGFVKKGNDYFYQTMMLDNTFSITITVSEEGSIQGVIRDLAFDEEYTNHRIASAQGSFVASVREAYEALLQEIKLHCTTMKNYQAAQANRISELIFKQYQDHPCFLWERTPDSGVYRNPVNGKWYGLIMHIDLKKISDIDRWTDIINVKLQEDHIAERLQKDGYYPAYHMNKKHWVSISLDDTLSDEEIMMCIEESHRFT